MAASGRVESKLLERRAAPVQSETVATVAVRFNAWQFEREEHLIVPLLKTAEQAVRAHVEEELGKPEEGNGDEKEAFRKWLTRAWQVLGDASLALASGFKGGFNVGGELKWDVVSEEGGPKAGFSVGPSVSLNMRTVFDTFAARRLARADPAQPASALDAYESLYFDLRRQMKALTGRAPRKGAWDWLDEAGARVEAAEEARRQAERELSELAGDEAALRLTPRWKEQARRWLQTKIDELRRLRLTGSVEEGEFERVLGPATEIQTENGSDQGGDESADKGRNGKYRLNLLFLIDDLDRCLPEKAVEMLESIKLFLEVPGCAFVLAVDDEMVERGILHRYRDYRLSPGRGEGDTAVDMPRPPITGAEYLEKIIHLPVRVPPPTWPQIKRFIESRPDTGELLRELDPKVRERLWWVFEASLPRVPRKVIRALELFALRQEQGKNMSDHDPVLLAQFVLIQLFAPELYRLLRERGSKGMFAALYGMKGERVEDVIARLSREEQDSTSRGRGGNEDESTGDRHLRLLRRGLELRVGRVLAEVLAQRVDFDPRDVLLIGESYEWSEKMDRHYRLTTAEAVEPVEAEQLSAGVREGVVQAPKSFEELQRPNEQERTRPDHLNALPRPPRRRRPAHEARRPVRPHNLSHFVASAASADPRHWETILSEEEEGPVLRGGYLDDKSFDDLHEALKAQPTRVNANWMEKFAEFLSPSQLVSLWRDTRLHERALKRGEIGREWSVLCRTINPPTREDVDSVDPRIYMNEQALRLEKVSLAGAYLRGLRLSGWELVEVEAERANLREAELTGAVLNQVRLAGARLSGAVLDGVQANGGDWSGVEADGCSTRGAEIHGVDLSRSNWQGSRFEGSEFTGAVLDQVRLAGARLSGAVLDGVQANGGDWSGVEADGCSMQGAEICGVDLSRSNWLGSNLEKATFENVTLDSTLSHGANFGGQQTLVDATEGAPLVAVARLATGHSCPVRSVAWSPDGTRLASASEDNSVRVWSLHERREVAVLQGHSSSVLSVAWSPNGKELASASEDHSVRVWSLEEQREVVTLQGHMSSVLSVAWSPDGTRLASASEDNSVRVWSRDEQREVATLEGHSGPVTSVAWSPDGKELASAGDESVRIWSREQRREQGETVLGLREVVTLQGHSGLVRSVAWSPGGEQLASASDDHSVRVWSRRQEREVAVHRVHSDCVMAVAWSPDGRQLASASSDHSVRVWSLDERREVASLEGHLGWVMSVAWSPNGKELASASGDNSVRVWWSLDKKDPEVAPLEGHSTGMTWMAWSPDGTCLASASSDNSVRVWSLDEQHEINVFPGHQARLRSVAWSPDGIYLASASEDRRVRVWSRDKKGEVDTLEGHSNAVLSVAWSPDGKQLASTSADNSVRVWSLDEKREVYVPVCVLEGHSSYTMSVAWSPNGKFLASASADQSVCVWDLQSQRLVRTLQGHSDWVMSVAWSPDGTRLASASTDMSVRVWSLEEQLAILEGHSAGVNSVAWSPDGTRIASASEDNSVRVWSPDEEREIAALEGHSARVTSVAWSSDGTRLFSASADGLAQIWRPEASNIPALVIHQSGQGRTHSTLFAAANGHFCVASNDGPPIVLGLWRDFSLAPDERRTTSRVIVNVPLGALRYRSGPKLLKDSVGDPTTPGLLAQAGAHVDFGSSNERHRMS